MALAILDVLYKAPCTSKQIQVVLNCSQATVARQLKKLNEFIVKIPNGKSPLYAYAIDAFGAGNRIPILIVDAYGNHIIAANLRPLAHGGYFVEALTGCPILLLGNNKTGLYDDLPYFLYDLRPQGFIGRNITKKLIQINPDYPANSAYWSAKDIGRYLSVNGDSIPGNIQIGLASTNRLPRPYLSHTESDFPELAINALSDSVSGSSAGGEQPKFTSYEKNTESHYIIKFSPQINNEIGSRWSDILISEYHAALALKKYGLPAAESTLIQLDQRMFLKSKRFDRRGEFGRLSMLSLSAIDAEFVGDGSQWTKVMDELHKNKLVSWQHVYDVYVLHYFGHLIANTDMHLGNLSLGIDGNLFSLLPSYDMCCMGYAPVSGNLPKLYNPFSPQKIQNNMRQAFSDALKIADEFWKGMINEPLLSSSFKLHAIQQNRLTELL